MLSGIATERAKRKAAPALTTGEAVGRWCRLWEGGCRFLGGYVRAFQYLKGAI
jgi:hypothetical protein